MALRRLIQPDLGAISRLLNFDEVEEEGDGEREDDVETKEYEREDGIDEQVIESMMKIWRMWKSRNNRRIRRFMQRKIRSR